MICVIGAEASVSFISSIPVFRNTGIQEKGVQTSEFTGMSKTLTEGGTCIFVGT